jgi:hypothetical protein
METTNIEQNLTPLERIAQIVSAIFHPLSLPAIAFTFLVVADSTHDLLHKLIVEGVAIIFSVILVPAYIFFLKRKGVVDSADITIREQRINPLLMAVVSYFIGFLLLKAVGASGLIQGLMRQFKSEVQQELMAEDKILRKAFDSQGIFWVCD